MLLETSERGTLDVERFDREPGRPILHGLLDAVDRADAAGTAGAAGVAGVAGAADAPRTSGICHRARILVLVQRLLPHMRPRTRDSVRAVGTTLRSWPQLASENALGAASVTTAARLLLLGAPIESGRYLVDLDRILLAGARAMPERDRETGACQDRQIPDSAGITWTKRAGPAPNE